MDSETKCIITDYVQEKPYEVYEIIRRIVKHQRFADVVDEEAIAIPGDCDECEGDMRPHMRKKTNHFFLRTAGEDFSTCVRHGVIKSVDGQDLSVVWNNALTQTLHYGNFESYKLPLDVAMGLNDVANTEALLKVVNSEMRCFMATKKFSLYREMYKMGMHNCPEKYLAQFMIPIVSRDYPSVCNVANTILMEACTRANCVIYDEVQMDDRKVTYVMPLVVNESYEAFDLAISTAYSGDIFAALLMVQLFEDNDLGLDPLKVVRTSIAAVCAANDNGLLVDCEQYWKRDIVGDWIGKLKVMNDSKFYIVKEADDIFPFERDFFCDKVVDELVENYTTKTFVKRKEKEREEFDFSQFASLEIKPETVLYKCRFDKERMLRLMRGLVGYKFRQWIEELKRRGRKSKKKDILKDLELLNDPLYLFFLEQKYVGEIRYKHKVIPCANFDKLFAADTIEKIEELAISRLIRCAADGCVNSHPQPIEDCDECFEDIILTDEEPLIPKWFFCCYRAEGDMDNVQGDDNESYVAGATVVDMEKANVGKNQDSHGVGFSDVQHCSSHKVTPADHDDERWLTVQNFSVTNSQAFGVQILSLNIFEDLINKGYANNALFKNILQHWYFKADVEILVKVNCSPLLSGALIGGFYYAEKQDGLLLKRGVTAYINLPESKILKYSDQQPVSFIIPFKSFKSALSHTVRQKRHTKCNVGQFRLFVASELRGTMATSATGTVMMRIFNLNAYGVCSRYSGDMLQSMIALKAFDAITSTQNDSIDRDRPSVDQIAVRVEPIGASGLNLMSGGSQTLISLGVSSNGRTNFPDKPDSFNRLYNICRSWGYFTKFNWTSSQVNGTSLLSGGKMKISAWAIDPTIIAINKKSESVRYLPPVFGVLDCFQLYRGSFELCFDFTGSSVQSGMIVVYFTPVEADPSVNDFVYHLSFGKSKREIIRLPFIYDRPWMEVSREFIGDGHIDTPLGYIKVLVENSLITNAASAASCDVLIYIRGGPDIDFSVPRHPYFKPVFSQVGLNSTQIVTKGGYQYYWSGVWRFTVSALIFRYGDTSDHITQFTGNLDMRKLYKLDPEVSFKYSLNGTTALTAKYFYFFKTTESEDYIYGTCFGSTIPATLKAKTVANPTKKFFVLDWGTDLLQRTVATSWSQSGQDGKILKFIEVEWPAGLTGDIDIEEQDILQPDLVDLPSLFSGMLSFGDKVEYAKELCHRSQFYASTSGNVKKSYDLECLWEVPIFPMGLDDSPNYILDQFGYNQIFCNAFRFGRGSFEFVLVFNTDLDEDSLLVSYVPYVSSFARTDRDINKLSDVAFESSAGSVIATSTNNNVVKMRIPYYNANNYLVLGVPNFGNSDFSQMYSNGVLRVFYNNCKELVHYQMSLFFSLAEDFEFDTFTGFSPVIPRIDVKQWAVSGVRRKEISDRDDDFEILGNYIGDGPISYVSKSIAKGVVDSVITDDVKCMFLMLKEKLLNIFGDTADIVKLFISQLVHILINPGLKTIVVAIVAFLVLAGWLVVDNMSSLISTMYEIYMKIYGGVLGQCDEEKLYGDGPAYNPLTGEFTFEMDQTDKVSLLTAIVSSIALALGYKVHKSRQLEKDLPYNFLSYLTSGLRYGLQSANNLFIFFRNNLSFFEKVVRWVVSYFNPYPKSINMLINESHSLQDWLDDVMLVLDPRNDEVLKGDNRVGNKLFLSAMIAQQIKCRFIADDLESYGLSSKQKVELMRICSEVIKKRDELVRMGKGSDVRYVPWSVYIFGKQNIGKTSLVEDLSMAILSSINYKYVGYPIYQVTPGKKHQDGAYGQPVWFFDDFAQIQEPSNLSEMLSLWFNIKSPATFMPSKAKLEDKEMRYNPVLVMATSNEGWPDLQQHLLCQSAYLRRRDVVIQASLKRGYDVKELIRSEGGTRKLERKEHLEFRIKKNNIAFDYNTQSEDILYDGRNVLSYSDLVKYLIEEHKIYYEHEMSQYIRRCSRLNDFMISDGETIEDMKKRYKQHVMDVNRLESIEFIEEYRALKKSDCELEKLVAREIESSNDVLGFDAKSGTSLFNQGIKHFFGDVGCKHTIIDENWLYLSNGYLLGIEKYKDIPVFFHSWGCDEDMIIPDQCCELDCRFADLKLRRLFVDNFLGAKGKLTKVETPPYCYSDEGDSVDNVKKLKQDLLEAGTSAEEKIYSGTPKKILYFLGVVGSIMASLGILYMGKKALTKCKATVKDVSDYDGDVYPDPSLRAKVKSNRVGRVVGDMDEDRFKGYLSKIRRNYFFIKLGSVFCRCLGLYGRCFLMPKHYLDSIELYLERLGVTTLRFYFNNVCHYLDWSLVKIKYIVDSELCVVKIPRHIRQFADIRCLFISHSDVSSITSKCLLVQSDFDEESGYVSYTRDKVFVDFLDQDFEITGAKKVRVASTGFRYNYSSKGGCMSLLLSDTDNLAPIVGIHVARVNKSGVSEAIVRETLDFLAEFDKDDKLITAGDCPYITYDDSIRLFPGVEILGVVNDDLYEPSFSKTKLCRSLLYEVFDKSTYELPPLNKFDARIDYDPLIESCKSHGLIPKFFPHNVHLSAISQLETLILENCVPMRQVGILSLDEVIFGIDGLDGYEHLILDTSEGVPYKFMRPANAHNKKWLISCNYDEHTYEIDEMLLKDIYDGIEKRKSGNIQNTMFHCNLKDAKLPAEKALIPGKVRVFCGAPVDYTIIMKMFFGDFIAAYMSSRFDLEHMIGVNVFSREWSLLARRLKRHLKYLCLDYKKFGDTLLSSIQPEFVNIVNKWYRMHQGDWEEWHDIVRKCLIYENIHSKRVIYNIVYVVFCGINSGVAMTVIINSFSNKYYMRAAFFIMYDGCLDFRASIVLFTYGDDLVLSTSLSFDPCNIVSIFSEFDIVVTSATKDDRVAFCEFDMITFLKGYFVYDEYLGLYIYRLERRALNEILQWSIKGPDEVDNLVSTCRSYLEHLWSYGKEEYETKLFALIKFWRNKGYASDLNFMSYNEIRYNRFAK